MYIASVLYSSLNTLYIYIYILPLFTNFVQNATNDPIFHKIIQKGKSNGILKVYLHQKFVICLEIV